MNELMLQRTLLIVSDALAAIPNVDLVGLQPHGAARNSVLAKVGVHGGNRLPDLHVVAEQVFLQSGVLVLFSPV